jgi:hypothetical protein
MRKSGRTCDQDEQTARRWIRGPIASPRDVPAPTKPAKSNAGAEVKPAKRFVEPYPYSDDQRAAIAATLAADGVGDDSAREIFIGAIAYDLALLEAAAKEPAPILSPAPARLTKQRPDQTQADKDSEHNASSLSGSEPSVATSINAAPDAEPQAHASVASLADTAYRLAASLRALDHDQRRVLGVALRQSDPFDRSHDEAYLTAIASELERIAQAAIDVAPRPVSQAPSAAPPTTEAPQATAAKPPTPPTAAKVQTASQPAHKPSATEPHPAALAFIRHAANVFEQCFDGPPSLKAQDPFARVLSTIAKTTGVPVPSQVRVLRQALGRH